VNFESFLASGELSPRPPTGAPPLDPPGGLCPPDPVLPPRFSHPVYGPWIAAVSYKQKPYVVCRREIMSGVICLEAICPVWILSSLNFPKNFRQILLITFSVIL